MNSVTEKILSIIFSKYENTRIKKAVGFTKYISKVSVT